jgi:thioredoxin 1
MAFNNACVHAHAKKDYARARAIADRAQVYAAENPYIYHAAGCAYAAVGDLRAALEQVKEALAKGYDHVEKVENDADLGELLQWPEFKQLFLTWRAEQAKSEQVVEAHEQNFELAVLRHDKPVLVDFTASWCGPCQRQAPIVERLAAESRGRYRVAKLDIDANEELSKSYDVRSVPTLIVFVNGEVKGRQTGLTDKTTLMRLLETAGVGADAPPAPSGPPPRPESVPADAEWIEKDKEWELVTKDADGKKEGPVRWWRKDGSLCCEAVFEHGVETGPYTRYHENGERSQWGAMQNDQRFGVCSWQRSTGATTENTIPPQLPKSIWRSEQEFATDGTMSLCRFYDKEGRELDVQGKPVPARPRALPAFAERFQVGEGAPPRWEDGRRRANDGERVGLWRYWDDAGKLVEEVTYDADARRRRAFGADARVTVEGAYAPEKGRFPGGGRNPGRPAGVWRFFDESGTVLAEGDLSRHTLGGADDEAILAFLRAPRPVGVPADARYDARGERWALGETGTSGARTGTWSFWSKDGRLEERLAYDAEGKSVHQMLFFASGKPSVEGSYDLDDDGDPDDKLGTWRVFSPDGTAVAEVDVREEPWKTVSRYAAATFADVVRMTKLSPSPLAEEAQKVGFSKLSDPDKDNRYCWGGIRHHVPVLLNALVRGEPALRRTAFGLLFDETFHQGTIYEASARLTPFFIRLVGDPTTAKEDRERYFGALRCYAESLARSLPQVDEDAPAAKWLGFMHDAFVRARSQFVAWARTGEPDVRDRAATLLTLGVFGGAEDVLPEIWSLFRAEREAVRRAQLALGFAKLAQSPDARSRLAAALE